MEKRKIDYGLQNLFIYKQNSEIETGFDSGYEQLGATELSVEVTREDTVVDADNRKHKTIPGTETISGTISTVQIDQFVYTEFMGRRLNLNGSVTRGNKVPDIGIAWAGKRLDENDDERLLIASLYNVKFGEITSTYATTTSEGNEAKVFEIPFTGYVSNSVIDSYGDYTSGMEEYVTPTSTTEADIRNMLAEMPLPNTDLAALGGVDFSVSNLEATGTTVTMTYSLTKNSYAGEVSASLYRYSDRTEIETMVLTEGVDQTATSTATLEDSTLYIVLVKNDEGRILYSENVTTGISIPAPTKTKAKTSKEDK